MDNSTEKHKRNSIDQVKRAFKEYLDKYFIYQELENKLKFLSDSLDRPEITKKRDNAKAEWKKASENYQQVLSSKK